MGTFCSGITWAEERLGQKNLEMWSKHLDFIWQLMSYKQAVMIFPNFQIPEAYAASKSQLFFSNLSTFSSQ